MRTRRAPSRSEREVQAGVEAAGVATAAATLVRQPNLGAPEQRGDDGPKVCLAVDAGELEEETFNAHTLQLSTGTDQAQALFSWA